MSVIGNQALTYLCLMLTPAHVRLEGFGQAWGWETSLNFGPYSPSRLLCCPGMVIAPDPYNLGVAPVRAEAGKLYFTKVARLLLDSRSEHPRGLASLASALGSGEHVDSPRILEVLYISIEY
jgi:hypothetical protein